MLAWVELVDSAREVTLAEISEPAQNDSCHESAGKYRLALRPGPECIGLRCTNFSIAGSIVKSCARSGDRSGALAELMPGAVIAAQRKNADSFMTEVVSFVTFWHIPNLNGRVECSHILQE